MTAHRSKVKISRLHSKLEALRSLHTFLVLALLATHFIASIGCSAYDDDFQGGSDAANIDAVNANDEIYETALLQQEVEASEKNHSMEEPAAADRLNETHHAQDINNSADVSSEATESEELHSTNSITEKSKDNTEHLPVLTTSIPVYVRKGKAEQFPHTLNIPTASIDPSDANLSQSDYVGDEELNTHTTSKPHSAIARMDLEGLVPLAMRLYQNGANALGLMEHDDNGLTEPQAPRADTEQQHEQQLPVQQPPKPFQSSASDSDEDYYEDMPDSTERQQVPQVHPVTNATPFTPTSVRNIAAARPGAGGMIWGTSTPPPQPAFKVNGATDPTIGKPADTLSANTGSPLGATPSTSSAITPAVAQYTTTPLVMPAILSELPESTTSWPITAGPGTSAGVGVTTKATPTRPAGKQGKQINISRRKLLPHEQLRNYIEDAYIRMPLAVIVDPSAKSLEKTKVLWREAMRTNLNIKIVLVSLNASGVPAAFNFNNTRQFLAGLNSIKEHDGGDSFVGILHASELVPYDSAVFISTAHLPPHTELVQDAAITLLKKRIRLYLMWYGEHSVSENETQEAVGGILGEVAIRSGGEILHIVGSANAQELEGNTLTIVADAFRGSHEIDIPVDTTLSSLHVKIDTPMLTATLETPHGDINLKNLVKIKSNYLTSGIDDQRIDAYVPLTKLRKATVYRLRLVPKSSHNEYSVFVRGERKPDIFLDEVIKRFDAYFLDGRPPPYPIRLRDGLITSVRTHDNLRFGDELADADNTRESPKSEVETFSDAEVYSAKTPVKPNATEAMPTAVINAVANSNSQRSVLQREVTKVEMGLQSQVLVAPGMLGQLYFDVTNTRLESAYYTIQVVDERRFLLRLQPQTLFLRPRETTTVSVTVLVPNGTPQGTVDKITFTCRGADTASLSLNLKVITTVDSQDTTSPSVSWEFGSRCEYVNTEGANCGERFWTLDITAQDWQTGIMRLQTTPSAGLFYRNSYTVGSTEPLKATYIATCCEPKLSITAYDIAGNQRTHNIDVRDIVLTEASIAAIVLGALLLILLIVLLVAGIVWCCRRRQVSLDLPTYRSHSTRSME